jgi:hypothetical protein
MDTAGAENFVPSCQLGLSLTNEEPGVLNWPLSSVVAEACRQLNCEAVTHAITG